MRDDARRARQDAIAQAAYAVLAERGYAGTSMLGIAKRAKASNETLYRWYGDKTGLFAALIEDNAAEVTALLTEALADRRAPMKTLAALGPTLCMLLTSDRAVALNQAAAADPTGELGATLTRAGRGSVLPLVVDVFAQGLAAGDLSGAEAPEAARLWLDLLIGDLQIRRVIGAIPALTPEAAEARAARALSRLCRLLPPA